MCFSEVLEIETVRNWVKIVAKSDGGMAVFCYFHQCWQLAAGKGRGKAQFRVPSLKFRVRNGKGRQSQVIKHGDVMHGYVLRWRGGDSPYGAPTVKGRDLWSGSAV